MRIISSIPKLTLLAALFSGMSAFASPADLLPQSVTLTDHRSLTTAAHKLYIESASGGGRRALSLPLNVSQSLKKSSSIVFPEAQSLTVGGKEYVLVVVSQPSSKNPTGYCGAGEESTIYVLQISDVAGVSSFSDLVQSCLRNIDLASDGVKSPFQAIRWDRPGTGFRISWMTDAAGAEVTRRYNYSEGHFKLHPYGTTY